MSYGLMTFLFVTAGCAVTWPWGHDMRRLRRALRSHEGRPLRWLWRWCPCTDCATRREVEEPSWGGVVSLPMDPPARRPVIRFGDLATEDGPEAFIPGAVGSLGIDVPKGETARTAFSRAARLARADKIVEAINGTEACVPDAVEILGMDVPALYHRLRISHDALFRIDPAMVPQFLSDRLRYAGFYFGPGAQKIHRREDPEQDAIVYEQRKPGQRVMIPGEPSGLDAILDDPDIVSRLKIDAVPGAPPMTTREKLAAFHRGQSKWAPVPPAPGSYVSELSGGGAKPVSGGFVKECAALSAAAGFATEDATTDEEP